MRNLRGDDGFGRESVPQGGQRSVSVSVCGEKRTTQAMKEILLRCVVLCVMVLKLLMVLIDVNCQGKIVKNFPLCFSFFLFFSFLFFLFFGEMVLFSVLPLCSLILKKIYHPL